MLDDYFSFFFIFSPWQEKVSADGVAAQDAPQAAPNQDVWRARDRKGGLSSIPLLQNGFGIIRSMCLNCFGYISRYLGIPRGI